MSTVSSADMLTGAIVVLVAAVIWFHLKKFSYWSSRNINGPTPWPFFGTNFYYLFNNKLELDAKWNKKYGKVYGLYEGYWPVLRANDNELINFVYVKQFRNFSSRHDEFIYSKLQRNWLFFNSGKEWSARRALVSPLFSTSKIKLMLSSMSECVNRFLKEVERRSNELKLNGTPANNTAKASNENEQKEAKGVSMCKTDISAMTLDVIASNFYGLKINTYRDNGNEFLKSAYNMAAFELGRFLLWIMTPHLIAKALIFDILSYSKIEYFDLLAKKIIRERRQQAEGTTQKRLDVVQALIDAKLDNTNEHGTTNNTSGSVQGQDSHQQQLTSLSDTEIRGQMTFLFIAGFETTAQTLNSCLYELAHQPEAQEQLYNELEGVFEANLETVASTSEPIPSEYYSNLMELTLLDAFISETLRLYSPIIELNRRAEQSIAIPLSQTESLLLPEGTSITTNSFIVQRDPDYWPEPDKFDLTRFLPENRDKIKPGSYLPFGLGNRTCLGMRFALLEIKLALAKIILNYHIAPISKEYPPKFQQNLFFLLLAKNDFKLIPRS